MNEYDMSTTKKLINLNLAKLKTFILPTTQLRGIKRQGIKQEKILTNCISDIDSASGVQKEPFKTQQLKQSPNNPFGK